MSTKFFFAFFAALAMPAQDPRGAITGRVFEHSGAVVAGAAIRATNIDTNVKFSAHANAEGNFEILYLAPGPYKIEIAMAGFETFTRSGIDVHIGDRLQIDAKLELSGVKQSVDVSAEAPLLESANANLGQVIGSKQIEDMPLRGASLASLYATAPGVVIDTMAYDGPWNIAQASSFSMGGSSAGVGGIEYTLDGIGNNSYSGLTAFVPPADMVQEVRIQTNSYDAAVGHSFGGSINVALKSGTNALRGSLGATGTAGPLITRNFFVDQFIFNPATGPITDQKIHDNTPAVKWLRYSAVVGGPLVLPKIYNGKNKTFWIFGMQVHNRKRPISGTYSVPTVAQRGGDFSALLALGASYQIYDPSTAAATSATRYSRAPFAGNIIPASRIGTIAKGIAGYYPLPNTTGAADSTNNYFRTRPETQDLYQPEGRIDQYFSEKYRMFVRYTHSDFYGHFDQLIPGSTIRGRRRQRPERGLAVDNVFVLGGTKVLDIRYGLTWFREFENYDNSGYDLSTFGFPASFISQLNPNGIAFPEIAVSGALTLGQAGGLTQINYSHSLLGTFNMVMGNHNLKIGFDGRMMLDNTTSYGNVSPHMDFAGTYTNGPVDNSAAGPGIGQSMASLLLGIPTGGFSDINASRADRSRLYGLYLQDDWRLSRRLTLNVGLRYEYESPVTERYDRSTRDFNFLVTNPIQTAVQAQYAKNPIPQIPVFLTPGGVTFAGVNGNPRGFRDPYYRALMPRFGLAYSLRPRVIFRGGFGIFFAPSGADFVVAQQPGFSQRTNITPSLDGGLTFAASISNPFPTGLTLPAGASGGLLTYLGRQPTFFPSNAARPYNQRWSGAIQFEPLRKVVAEIGYIGSKAVGLPATTDFDPVPRQYLSTSPVRDAAAINLLTANIANPFLNINGFQGSTYYSALTLQRAQLLKPLPQFSALTAGLPAGSSWYHALTARVERRFGRGFQIQGSFTQSRTREAINYLNPTDASPEHVISNIDRPTRIVGSVIWELPFGKGRTLFSSVPRVVNQIIGGWQVQSMFQRQSGPGLAFGNVLYYSTLDNIPLSEDKRSLQQWFDTSQFEKAAGKALANNIRAFPSRISGARAAGIVTLDASMFKTFSIYDKLRVQFRAEAEGIANHPNFAGPNVNPTAAAFGQVTATQTGQEERRVSLGLKLIF